MKVQYQLFSGILFHDAIIIIITLPLRDTESDQTSLLARA